jgi:hypothetical protein
LLKLLGTAIFLYWAFSQIEDKQSLGDNYALLISSFKEQNVDNMINTSIDHDFGLHGGTSSDTSDKDAFIADNISYAQQKSM